MSLISANLCDKSDHKKKGAWSYKYCNLQRTRYFLKYKPFRGQGNDDCLPKAKPMNKEIPVHKNHIRNIFFAVNFPQRNCLSKLNHPSLYSSWGFCHGTLLYGKWVMMGEWSMVSGEQCSETQQSSWWDLLSVTIANIWSNTSQGK